MTIAPLEPVSQAIAAPRAGAELGAAPASAAAPTVSTTPATSTAAPILNPDPVIDASLGIVVLHYFSTAGDLTQTVPSRQQLDTYQIYGMKNDGPPHA